jgi:uncharacterized protein Veg
MSLRVTRQYTDALIEPDGLARVSRQYVDVVTETDAGKARVTRQYVDVLTIVPYPSTLETPLISIVL